MDPIDDMLGMGRRSSSRYARVKASGEWGIEFVSRDHDRLVVIARGACMLVSDELPGPLALAADDAFIVRAGRRFTLMDQVGRPVVHCEDLLADADEHTAYHGTEGVQTEIVLGRFSFEGTDTAPLMALLPGLLHIRLDDKHSDLLRATLRLIALETSEDGLGLTQIVNRLADVLFIQALRAWSVTDGRGACNWLTALQHPQLARAMRAVHSDMGRPWTVEALAYEAGLSRSAFASLFRELTGETPLAYLTFWRMYRAKQLLTGSDQSLLQIAQSVGYDTDTAFSRAFKRTQGLSPGQWRRNAKSITSGSELAMSS